MERVVAGPASEAPARDAGSKGPIDRLLGVFADVRAGEGTTAVLLMLNIFLLLAAYYLLKTIREPLILSVPHGAEMKSYSAAAAAGLLVLIIPLYSAIASRVSRVRLINSVTLFFVACLVAFFVLYRAQVPIGVAFFIWVSIFNVMIVAQLWAFANDIYTVEQGQRLFAIVGIGATLGAIAGSFATGQLVKSYGISPFMLGGAALLAICMFLTNVIHFRERHRAAAAPPLPAATTGGDPAPRPGVQAASARASETAGDAHADAAIRGRGGFRLVFSDRYLLMIGCLMLVYNLVNTTGEYILGHTVVAQYAATHGAAATGGLDEKKVIGEFYGNFFTLVNILTAVLQAFVVSRVIKYFGVRSALLVLPIVALIGYGAMAFVPVLAFIRAAKLAENSLDYSLQQTTRNALYLPTSREAKYKAKQANDTFFVRFGDMVSGLLVFAGTTWLGFASRQFALVNMALIVLWIVLAVWIGRRYRQLAAEPGRHADAATPVAG